MDLMNSWTRRSFVGALAALGASAHAFQTVGNRKLLVVGTLQAAPVIDPAQRYDVPARTLQQAMYDGLVKYEGDPAAIKPWLATSWTVSDDAKVWTFKLDPRAKFHNGDPVNAQAVKDSFARTLKVNKGPAWMFSKFLAPEHIEVVDAQTVRFSLSQPYAPFLSLLPWWYIVNVKEAMSHEENGDMGQKWLIDHAAGSGPFRLKRVEPNALYELQADDQYWKGWAQPEAQRLAGVVYRIMAEGSSRRAAVARGDIDIASWMSAEDITQLTGSKGIVIASKPGNGPFQLMLNTQGKFTSDLNLRKALAYAFNYDALLAVYNGRAQLLDSPFTTAVQGHVTIKDMPRKDLAKAAAYLAKSKWPKGDIELEFVQVQGFEEQRQIGLILLDSFKALNIRVKITPLTWANMQALLAKPETAPDIFPAFTTPASTDPDSAAVMYHKDSWGQYQAAHFLNDPELQAMIEKARALPKWEDRAPIYARIQQRIVDDQPSIFGMSKNRDFVMRDWVKGFVDSPARYMEEFDLYALSIGR